MESESTALSGVALITGAASGIGRGVALSFAAAGCEKLFLGDINGHNLEETASQVRSQYPSVEVHVQHVDISNEESVQAFIDGCVATYGRVDYANNVAGVVPSRLPITETDVSTYDLINNVNLYGTWLCHRAQIRQMLTQEPLPGSGHNTRGVITSISSLSGLNASPGMSTYCASKHGIVGICKTDAQDYSPHGIRINAVCPGMIATDLFWKTSLPGMAEKMANATPVRRLGVPEDVGETLVWLASPKASFVCGLAVPVDGGLSLYRP